MKNFFRKVAFGIGPNENVPSDPLQWAKEQLNDVPQFSWKGKKILKDVSQNTSKAQNTAPASVKIDPEQARLQKMIYRPAELSETGQA